MSSVLIFSFNDPDSSELADIAAHAFRTIGWHVTVCELDTLNGLAPWRMATEGIARIPLSDTGYDSIPRMSSYIYKQCYDDDLDFPALLGLNLWQVIADLPVTQTTNVPPVAYLHPDSAFRQKLYGFASRIEEMLDALQPELILIQQGGQILTRILLAKAMKRNLPWLVLESPFFPNHLLLDPYGQHFLWEHNQITKDCNHWQSTVLTPEQEQKVAEFRLSWQSQRASKYPQSTPPIEDLTHFLATPGPILFVPMQVPHDANVYFSLGLFSSLADYYQSLVDQLPAGWRAIFKPHPFNTSSIYWQPPTDPRFFIALEANIHDLIRRADAVAVFSSNVGLEALLYDKPVLVGGRPYYRGKGLTIDLTDRSHLSKSIAEASSFRPDTTQRDRLLHYILNEYLIPEGDTAALCRKLARLDGEQRTLTDPRAPFCDTDPTRLRELRPMFYQYQELAKKDLSHNNILRQLNKPPSSEGSLALLEKDVPRPWLHMQESGLMAAYLFVTRLARSNSVLDYGCGNGSGAWLLAKYGARVTACAFTSQLYNYAQRTWRHRRVSFCLIPPEALLEGALPVPTWQLALLIDTLSGVYRPIEILTAIATALTEDGALLVRLADPRRTIAPQHHSPLQPLTSDDITKWCERSKILTPVCVFFQQGNVFRAMSHPSYDSLWVLLCRKAETKATWRRRLDECLSLPLPALPNETNLRGLTVTMLRRRERWLRKNLFRVKNPSVPT